MSPPPSQVISLLLLAVVALRLIAISEQQPITLAGCPDKCGNISIPYPFGMKPGCFLPGFNVTCNYTFSPPRAFFASAYQRTAEGDYSGTEVGPLSNLTDEPTRRVELIDVSVMQGEARAYSAVSYDCSTAAYNHTVRREQTILPEAFLFSATRNVLTAVGFSATARLMTSMYGSGQVLSACISILGSAQKAVNGSCMGLGCCQSMVTKGHDLIVVNLMRENNNVWGTSPCIYGMLVQKSWYNFSSPDLFGYDTLSKRFTRGVPVVLDFAIRNGTCPAEGQAPPQDFVCRSRNSLCVAATNGPGYFCSCQKGYNGNPYIPDGCQDIDECALRDLYPCYGICQNMPGGYDCRCKRGWEGNARNGTCTEKFPLPAKVAVGVIAGISIMVVLLLCVLLVKERRRMREFFIKNGGPILEKINNIKIFKKEELKRITENYSKIIGKGGFGEVYKGLLGDNLPVAVKKSINVNEAQKEQFANEVIVQSRIIHKNIVKLIGCCLEVDVPMLVYEFLSRGSLHDILHGSNKEPLSLDLRLDIAVESAEGLAYMHAKTSNTILHGDVKPANILLDDNFIPKVSDFGISKLIAIDKAQHAKFVIGDRSYMDPIYLHTGLLTKKSDVYSFGVVLLELITRKKAIYGDNSSLVINFVDAYTNKRASDLFDEEIAAEKDIETLDNLAALAVECLKLNVDHRPEMTDVAERLQSIKRTWKK